MKGDDVKTLRHTLGCTARDLAGALGVEQAEVLAWERGELFPTKRYVTKMESFRASGLPKASRPTPQRASSARPADVAMARVLASPDTWRLVRKLLAHPALFDATTKLAEGYADPADEDG